jgi:hypothetical protein
MTFVLTEEELNTLRRLSSNGQPADPDLVLRLCYERDALFQFSYALEMEVRHLRAEVKK